MSWRLSVEKKQEIVDRRNAGWTVRELSQHFGVTPPSIYAILRRRGVEFTAPGPGRKRYTQGQKDEAVAMYQQGKTVDQIATHFLFSRSGTVYRWLKDAGIYAPRHRHSYGNTPSSAVVLSPRQVTRRNHLTGIADQFRVTPESLLRLYREQRGKCRICGRRIRWGVGVGKSLCVDHCHEAGGIRGFLCPACNTGLGHFRNSLSLLMNAASYISRFTRKGSPCESAK